MVEEILKKIKDELDMYRNPGSYMPEEYYIRCEAKAEALEEVIYIIEEQLKAEKNG